jgi:hypothetical protein
MIHAFTIGLASVATRDRAVANLRRKQKERRTRERNRKARRQ